MDDISMSDADLLKFAIENGMLDAALVQEKIEMQKRKDLLEKHPYKIWQGKDGRWRTYLPGDESEQRRLVNRGTREDVEKAVVEYWKEQLENPTLEEVFNTYNDSRLEIGQISDASHLRYKQDFERYFQPIKSRRIKSIRADELCDFLEKRVSELDLTSKAFSNFKTITKGMFKRAHRKKMVDFRVEEEVLDAIDLSDKRFRKVRKEDYQEVFSEDEYQKYVSYLADNSDLWNIALLLILITGVRGGEVVAIVHDDLDYTDDVFSIKIRRTETRYHDDESGKYVYGVKETPKTEAGIRQVIVPRQFNWIYFRLKQTDSDGFVFIGKNGNRFTTNSLRRRQERNCKKLGFYHKSPHKGRKTYGTILLDNHLDNNMILQQMGHTDITTTERFYHRNMKNFEKKADIISGIGVFGAFDYKIIKNNQTETGESLINQG